MQTASLAQHLSLPAVEPFCSRILFSGKSFLGDPTGTLFWPGENTLIVAGLHLAQGSYLEEQDVLLPPYDTATAIQKLEEAIDRYDPERVIALGNSFGAVQRGGLTRSRRDWLLEMMEGREWFWILGPNDAPLPEGIGGVALPFLTLGGLKFRAEPVRAPVANEIAGSLHPIAQVSQFGHVVRGRCFLANGMRLIVPSIGNYSEGLNVLSPELDPLLGQGGVFVWFVSGGRVAPIASAQLIDDRAA